MSKLQEALDGLDQMIETLEKSLKQEPLDKKGNDQDEELDKDGNVIVKKTTVVKKDDDLSKSVQASLIHTTEVLENLSKSFDSRFTELEQKMERVANVAAVPRSIQGLSALKKSLGGDNDPSTTISQNTQQGRSVIKQGLIKLFDSADESLQKSLGREILGFDAGGKLGDSISGLLETEMGVKIV